MHLGWAAQWLLYEAELSANLSRPALVVPVFEEEVWACSQPPRTALELQTCHHSGERGVFSFNSSG